MRIRVVGSVFAVLLSAGALASLGVSALEPVVLIPIDGEGSKYWSRWRGPSGQGTVTDTDYVVSSQQRVFAYDPGTGTELWTVRGNSREVIPTPVVGHGLVFCSSGRAGPTLAIKPGGKGDVTATHVAWSSPRGSPFVPSALVHGDLLYMINDMQSILTVVDARTGTSVYQDRLGEPTREVGRK